MRVLERLMCEVSGCDADDVAMMIASTSSDSLSVLTSCLRSIHGADFANQPNNNWQGSIRGVLRSIHVGFVHKCTRLRAEEMTRIVFDLLRTRMQQERWLFQRLRMALQSPYIRVQNGF